MSKKSMKIVAETVVTTQQWRLPFPNAEELVLVEETEVITEHYERVR